MSALGTAGADEFELDAIRRGVVTVWFISTDDPAATLGTAIRHDRGFGRRFLAFYDPTLPVTPIGDFPLNRSAPTGVGEYYIGGYEGLAVLQTVIDDVSQLSKLPTRLRQEISATDVYACSTDSASGFGAFAHWHAGELKRAFAATRYRTLEDIGLPCPAESPYWAGEHRPTGDADNQRREGVGLPFIPAELADAVVASWLGFDPHSPAADIPVSGFAVDGRKAAPTSAGINAGVRQADRRVRRSGTCETESTMWRYAQASGHSAKRNSELHSDAPTDEAGRTYDDYEVHGGDSGRDFAGELADIRKRTRSRARQLWQRARRRAHRR